MPIRVTGLNSGLDTDSIIQELMSAYNAKTEKYEKEQTKISWKQEIWSDLNTKVNSFYKSVGNLRYSSGYSLYKTTSSDSSKATVTASGSAITGTQKLHVLATAQSAYLTGGKLTTSSGGTVSTDTKLYDLGYTSVRGTLRVTTQDDDGKTVKTDINVTNATKISDIVTNLQDAGLNASFDENNGRFYLSSKTGGESGNFQISQVDSKGRVSDAGGLLYALGLSTKDIEITEDSTMGEVGYGGASGKFRLNTKDVNGNSVMIDNIEFSSETSVKTVIDSLNKQLEEKNVNVRYKYENGKIVSEANDASKEKPDVQVIEFDQLGLPSSNSTLLQSLGFVEKEETFDERKAVKLDGNDAAIVLNGVVYTSKSNVFSINGLNITVSATTDDDADIWDEQTHEIDKAKASKLGDSTAITISTNIDAQGIYDKVKDFLTDYNSIINELTKLYNADSAKDYEPLTDDEKSEMSDTEIAKWETKIKDALLRRDTNLSSIMSAMKNAMSQTIKINDKTYALSSFGIGTLYYGTAPTNEESAYHIDGDEDDENTSGNTDKLLAAINDDPDTVVAFMKQLATNLYDALDSQMQSSSLRSRYSIYNDKELQDQYDNYTTIISDWEDKVSDKEDYYYEKFADMETAMADLNSQTSALSGLLGS